MLVDLGPAACGPQAQAILAQYAHGTDAEAVSAYKSLSCDAGYGWLSWTWASTVWKPSIAIPLARGRKRAEVLIENRSRNDSRALSADRYPTWDG